jgi:hypothetical protein
MRAKKIMAWTVWTFVGLATVITLFYAEEDWRGARAWHAVLQQMRDAGEPLTLRELIPPGSTEADLSKTRMFANENPEVSEIRIPGILGDAPKLAAVVPLREIDLKAWQEYFRSLPRNHLPAKSGTPAADVLAALSPLDPLFTRLDEVLAIPGGICPLITIRALERLLWGLWQRSMLPRFFSFAGWPTWKTARVRRPRTTSSSVSAWKSRCATAYS